MKWFKRLKKLFYADRPTVGEVWCLKDRSPFELGSYALIKAVEGDWLQFESGTSLKYAGNGHKHGWRIASFMRHYKKINTLSEETLKSIAAHSDVYGSI